MNTRIKEIATEVGISVEYLNNTKQWALIEAFTELIVQECRTVVTEVYRNTPLELCGPLLTADEEIVKRFYGVEE